jgi:hypothetical protein
LAKVGFINRADDRTALNGSFGVDTAIAHALRHSDIWAAAACHSGDMDFELCYLPDMPAVVACPRRQELDRQLVAATRGG